MPLETMPHEQAGEAHSTAASAEKMLELRDVEKQIAQLPPERKEALLLVVVGGLSYKEAAKTLDIPIGTLMSRIARARSDLKAPEGATPKLRRVK